MNEWERLERKKQTFKESSLEIRRPNSLGFTL
jgi:hypothetical protein